MNHELKIQFYLSDFTPLRENHGQNIIYLAIINILELPQNFTNHVSRGAQVATRGAMAPPAPP